MNIISRFSVSSFNLMSILQQSSRRCVLNGFQPRYFSTFVSSHFAVHSRTFYAIPPSRQNFTAVARKEKEMYRSLDMDRASVWADRYSKANGIVRSWVARQSNPDKLWKILTNQPSFGNKVACQSLPEETSLEHLQQLLEQKGGRGLKNISKSDLTKIWEKFKQNRAYNEMVEMFHCRRPSDFTADPKILLDYGFAQLKSSYCQPSVVAKIAENLIKKENLAEAHYVLGLSHMVRACVAKTLMEFTQQGKKDLHLEDRYRECFKLAAYKDSAQHYREALVLAEAEFKQAFTMKPNGEHALAGILNLIEQGNLQEAQTWSESIWQQLHAQHSLTTQDVQALLIAGLVTNQPFSTLENMTQEMLAKEPELKTEYVENLQLLTPHFLHIQQMIETVQSLSSAEKI